MFKPLAWHGAGFVVKNLLELKNAQRVVIDANIMENCWLDGQQGYAVLFTTRGEDGAMPWATVSDVQFTNNIVRHVGEGVGEGGVGVGTGVGCGVGVGVGAGGGGAPPLTALAVACTSCA